jgi:hypothetical protein
MEIAGGVRDCVKIDLSFLKANHREQGIRKTASATLRDTEYDAWRLEGWFWLPNVGK